MTNLVMVFSFSMSQLSRVQKTKSASVPLPYIGSAILLSKRGATPLRLVGAKELEDIRRYIIV